MDDKDKALFGKPFPHASLIERIEYLLFLSLKVVGRGLKLFEAIPLCDDLILHDDIIVTQQFILSLLPHSHLHALLSDPSLLCLSQNHFLLPILLGLDCFCYPIVTLFGCALDIYNFAVPFNTYAVP